MKNIVGCWLMLIWRVSLLAQHFSLEVSGHYGTIIRHTPKLTVRTGSNVWGQEVNCRFQTLGNKDWHARHRFPVFGISLLHIHLGAQTHGRVVACTPHIAVKIWDNDHVRTFFRFGTGLAWVENPYDYFNNPQQNALGSHWNSSVQFSLGSDFQLSNRVRATAGISFTHFSNGSAALPNYGLNIPTVSLGGVWLPTQLPDFQHTESSSTPPRQPWQGRVTGGVTWVEYIVLDGPKYPVWMGSVAAMWQPHLIHRWLTGFDIEHNQSVELWAYHSLTVPDRRLAHFAARRLGYFVGHEFLFDRIGVQLQLGRYVGSPRINRFVLSNFYSKLIFRVYLPEVVGVRPHVGLYLKAHKVIAEYLALNIGLDL